MSIKAVSIIGLGYIGLPTAAVLASKGTKVIGIDVNKGAVEIINQGKIHIVEPGLEEIVKDAVTAGLLKAFTTPQSADVFIIAVPTPFKGENHAPDLKYIEAACKSIAPLLKKDTLIILESTSPVGTTEQISAWLAELRKDLSFPCQKGENSDIRIAYCPERVLPGKVIEELVSNDRIIGGMTDLCSSRAIELYRIFVNGNCVKTNARTAELSKLTENAYRDVNIAFANELSLICDPLNIDVWELISLANRHPRVNILQPGPGVGGHCIAVDPWFIVSQSPKTANLIRTARNINDYKPKWVLEQVEITVANYLKTNPNKTRNDVTIACFGIAFKPNIDDLRGSPAKEIAHSICKTHPGKTLIVEPNITKLPSEFSDYNVALTNIKNSLTESDILVILVKHDTFLQCFKSLKNKAFIVDCQGIS